MLLQIPWGQANRKINFTLRLETADGEQVNQLGPAGAPVPVVVRGELEVGRPAGLPEGSLLDAPLALNIPRLILEPGNRYVWVLEVNNESHLDWRLPFFTRAMKEG